MKFIVAIQYYNGDRSEAMELAGLLADFEEKKREDVDFILCPRFDADEPEPAIVEKLRGKFGGVLVVRTTKQATGYPMGCNAQWADLITWAMTAGYSGDDAIFTTEADSFAWRRDWIDVVKEEWMKARAMDKLCMGCVIYTTPPHVNGNAVFIWDWAARCPQMLMNIPEKVAWDYHFGNFLCTHVYPTLEIVSLWQHENFDSSKLMRQHAFFHGVKDESGRNLMRKILGKPECTNLINQSPKLEMFMPDTLIMPFVEKNEQADLRLLGDASWNKWVVISSDRAGGVTNYNLSEFVRSTLKTGRECWKISCRGKNGEFLKDHEIWTAIKQTQADKVLWTGAEVLRYVEVFRRLYPIKFYCLWVDDPLIRIEMTGTQNEVMTKQFHLNLRHYCWDGFWRKQLKQKYGVESEPFHLGVNADDFYTTPTRLSDDIVFLGNLTSPIAIEGQIDQLPEMCRLVVRMGQSYIDEMVRTGEPIPSWLHIWKLMMRKLHPGDNRLLQNEKEYVPKAWLLLWAIGKNEARVRVLKIAQMCGPLRIYTSQGLLDHASGVELRGMIGNYTRHIQIFDTTETQGKELAHLYHYGRVHINATDPQSVQGGIPYRVFQTAASGRCLITDTTPELEQCFTDKKELLLYRSLQEFGNLLASAMEGKIDLEVIGMAARVRVETEHTWRHRIEQLEQYNFLS
jgi:hypothetical protein